MKARITIFTAALVLSLLVFWRTPTSPEDAALMNTAGGQFGAWFGTFCIILAIVGVMYMLGKAVYRGIQKLRR